MWHLVMCFIVLTLRHFPYALHTKYTVQYVMRLKT